MEGEAGMKAETWKDEDGIGTLHYELSLLFAFAFRLCPLAFILAFQQCQFYEV